jgi:hypothetical protein
VFLFLESSNSNFKATNLIVTTIHILTLKV